MVAEQIRRPTSLLIKNIVYNVLGQSTVLLVSFIAVRFIFRRLGGDAFGVIYFNALLTTLIVTVLDFGVSTTTIREVARSSSTEPLYVRDLIRTASLFYWVSCLVLALAVYFGAPVLVDHWIHLATMPPSTAIPALRVLGIAALVALPRVLYTSLFRGLQRMEFNNAIDVGGTLLTQGGVVAILFVHGSFQVVVFWIALSAVLTVATYIVVAARLFGPVALVPYYSAGVVRRNLGFGLHMVAISTLSIVFTQGTQLILSTLLAISQFGFYGFLNNLTGRAAFVSGAVAQAGQPSLNKLVSLGEFAAFQSQFRKLQDLVSFGSAPIFALIPFASLPLLSYLFSPSVAESLLLPATFLSLGFYMNAMLVVPFVASLAVGRPQIATQSNLVALVVVLPVTAALVVSFGLAGAAFSWVFYHIFAYLYQIPRYSRQCLRVPVMEWYERLLKVSITISVSYGLAWVILSVVHSSSLLALALAFVAATVVYFLGAYRQVGPELRTSVLAQLRILRSWSVHPQTP